MLKKLLSGLILLSVTGIMSIMPVIAQDGSESADDTKSRYADLNKFRGEDGAFILGEPDAPVTVIVFADFLCPYCHDYLEVSHQFIDEYVATGQASFEYRLLPVVNPDYSPLMAQVAECADILEPGLFWDAYEILYVMGENRDVSPEIPQIVADELSLDADDMVACIDTAQQYLNDSQLAQILGINGTPAVRARVNDGRPDVITFNEQPVDRGGAPFEVLSALVEGSPNVQLGMPEPIILDESFASDTSLISGEPCSAPCWNGITPSETSWEEALAILETSDLNDLQIIEGDQSDARAGIWLSEGGQECCQVISFDGETVDYIQIQIAPGVSLGSVIDEHGEPAFLIGQQVSALQAVMILIYPEVSMMIVAYVNDGVEGDLAEDSPVVRFTYLPEADTEDIISTTPLHAWEGYQSYADYMQGEFENIPQS